MQENQSDSNKLSLAEEHGVLPPLASMMDIELVIGKNGKVLIKHSKKLPYFLKWAEYDDYTGSINFVSAKGDLQQSGLDIPDHILPKIQAIEEIAVARSDGSGHIQDMYIVPFINTGGAI